MEESKQDNQIEGSAQKKEKEQPEEKSYVTSATPPWHTVAILVLVASYYIREIETSLETIDEAATVTTFSRRLFPNLLSIAYLGWIRLALAMFVWAITIYLALSPEGDLLGSFYLPGSKLQSTSFRVRGLKTLTPFTVWSWILLGIGFTMSATIALTVAHNGSAKTFEHDSTGDITSAVVFSPWFLRIALIVWELGAANSILTSIVVTYGIWPLLLQEGVDTAELKNPITLVMHNINAMLSMTEVCLLGGLPVRWDDIAFAPLFGIVYLLFSWYMMDKWTTPDKGPQFLYFFMDTTLGLLSSISLLVVFVVLQGAYGLFVVLHRLLDQVEGGLVVHGLAVLVVCALVGRFRD